MAMDLTQHPCFNDSARHKFGRLHLPVAPACNIQCNFCNRKYDCANESRPGVTSLVLNPAQALAYLARALEKAPHIKVAGIAGPGDPFANGPATMETLRLVRARFPELLLCVATNGLELAPYAAERARLQVSHVSVTVNAVDPAIGAKINPWVRFNGRVYHGEEAAQLLYQRQVEGIQALKQAGVTVKANCVVVKGVNDRHVEAVGRALAGLSVDVLNPIALYPAEGAVFTPENAPDARDMVRVKAGLIGVLPLMSHCARCRADAAGLLGQDDPKLGELMRESAAASLTPLRVRTRVAVASMEGLLVNEGLGRARRFLVYELKEGAPALVGERPAPAMGGGDQRWKEIASLLSDCGLLLAGEAGPKPSQILADHGLDVMSVEGLISQLLPLALAGGDLAPYIKRSFSCSTGCGGGKQGCA
jgi:nitrogen fixation protein NifB